MFDDIAAMHRFLKRAYNDINQSYPSTLEGDAHTQHPPGHAQTKIPGRDINNDTPLPSGCIGVLATFFFQTRERERRRKEEERERKREEEREKERERKRER